MSKSSTNLEKKIKNLLYYIILEDLYNDKIRNYLSISDVKINGDNSVITLFVLDSSNSITDKELSSLRNFLKPKLVRTLDFKRAPEIKIVRDQLLDNINKIENLIDKNK